MGNFFFKIILSCSPLKCTNFLLSSEASIREWNSMSTAIWRWVKAKNKLHLSSSDIQWECPTKPLFTAPIIEEMMRRVAMSLLPSYWEGVGNPYSQSISLVIKREAKNPTVLDKIAQLKKNSLDLAMNPILWPWIILWQILLQIYINVFKQEIRNIYYVYQLNKN